MVDAVLHLRLAQLHNPRSGRLDAQRIASYLDVPLTRLAAGLGKSHQALHKTPDAPSVQTPLRPVKVSLDILEQMLGDRAMTLVWLNGPHPDLGMRTPLSVILDGRAEVVEHMLTNAMMGIPS